MVDIVGAVAQMRPYNHLETLQGAERIKTLRGINELRQRQVEQSDRLRNALQSGDLNALAMENPVMALQSQQFQSGQLNQAVAELLPVATAIANSSNPNAMARAALPTLRDKLPSVWQSGIDSGLADLDNTDPEETKAAFAQLAKILNTYQSRAAGRTTGMRDLDYEHRFMTPEEQEKALLIRAGLLPRAGSSAIERIAQDSNLADDVAETQSDIRERVKFAETSGADRAKRIDKGADQIRSIDTNINAMDRAIAALDAGASTGVIESQFLPTLRASTIQLEQVRRELGLDVIGSVTFGALSEGELQLALETALPIDLQPAELRQWLLDRKAAQQKLRQYYADQIEFLDKGGTIAGFVREQERNRQSDSSADDVYERARDAISRGADPDAVRNRLTEAGYDPSQL